MAGLGRDLLSCLNGLGEKKMPSRIFKVRRALVSGRIENEIQAAESESVQTRCLPSKSRD